MAFTDFSQLPENVRAFLFSPELSQFNGEIGDKYFFNREQLDFILTLEEGIFLKQLAVLELPNRLEDLDRAEYYDLRALALDLAYKILWPLQDYLGEVDRLILRLGGKVPKAQHLQQTTETSGLPEVFDTSIKEALDRYTGFREYRLTTNKIINKEDRLVSPNIDNWLKDYIHFSGAGQHGSLERAKYLSSSQNALSLGDAERESLRQLLISYDDNNKVHFDASGNILTIAEFKKAEPEKKAAPIPEESLAAIQQKLINLDKSLLRPEILLSEAAGDIYKLRDILWQALGLMDQDKVVSCLRVLVERRALDQLIKQDNRFINVLKRFISVRYGYNVEHNFEQNSDLALSRRIFLEMILSEKLGLGAEAPPVAFYLTNILPDDTQLVYFDDSAGRLKWRGLQVVRDKLVWLDELEQTV